MKYKLPTVSKVPKSIQIRVRAKSYKDLRPPKWSCNLELPLFCLYQGYISDSASCSVGAAGRGINWVSMFGRGLRGHPGMPNLSQAILINHPSHPSTNLSRKALLGIQLRNTFEYNWSKWNLDQERGLDQEYFPLLTFHEIAECP